MISSLVLAMALVGCGACQERATSLPLWGRLEPGEHAVGLRVLPISDPRAGDPVEGPSREDHGVEVLIWYPALRDPDDERLAFRDYLTMLPDVPADASGTELRDWLASAMSPQPETIDPDTLDGILASSMATTRDAQPQPGKYPLVLWTVRDETEVAQSVLSEFLASHGYVVAVVRRTRARVPPPWALESDAAKEAAFATHLSDLTAALARLRSETSIDASRMATVTWSYGAELASRVQVENPGVRLVVGLSSNPLSTNGVFLGAGGLPDVERLTARYVLLTERIAPNGDIREAPEVLPLLPAGADFIRFDRLAHGNFNALEGMIPALFGIDEVHPWSSGGSAAQLGYETIARGVLFHLDRYLGERDDEVSPGDAWRENLPPGFVTITHYDGGAR